MRTTATETRSSLANKSKGAEGNKTGGNLRQQVEVGSHTTQRGCTIYNELPSPPATGSSTPTSRHPTHGRKLRLASQGKGMIRKSLGHKSIPGENMGEANLVGFLVVCFLHRSDSNRRNFRIFLEVLIVARSGQNCRF